MASAGASPHGIHPTGFTTLQDGGPKPKLDIIFVHGLNGRPDKSWTYTADHKAKPQSWSLMNAIRKTFQSNPSTAESSNSESTCETKGDVFWPKELLAEEPWAKEARILTYGYDADVFRIADNVNFSTISSHGESLLHALARIRVTCQTRPLMFIVHSLGGLVVKSTLNKSAMNGEKELRAVVESTFAAIFFGTPHRGSDMAQFGETVAKAASILTGKPYNKRIVGNLGPNNEILSNLRNDFEKLTLRTMREKNNFESSSFQEAKGYSSIRGFHGKIVEDDACEMGSHDRNDHINKNHMDMIKFSGSLDPEYEKVAGEVRRHIQRIEDQLDSRRKREFLESLRIPGDPALERLRNENIPERTLGTLEWIYSAKAKVRNEDKNIANASLTSSQLDLATWLRSGIGMYWITGKPGSGKSTSMKHILNNLQTQEFLECHGIESDNATHGLSKGSLQSGLPDRFDERSKSSGTSRTAWTVIGIFITNRGTEDQKQWRPLLLGAVHQLLEDKPELIAGVMDLAHNPEIKAPTAKRRRLGSITGGEVQWTTDDLEQILLYCKAQLTTRCKVLVLLDGLDELEHEDDTERCIDFLRRLCGTCNDAGNIFKTCLSGRSESTLTRLLSDTPFIEIHDHTYDDIRKHVQSRLGKESRLRGRLEEDEVAQLSRMIRYITENASGVFLWARSICNLMIESLHDGETFSAAYERLTGLPKEVAELYTYTLRRIDPHLKLRAYIMLETVLRTRAPLTLLELSLVVHVAERKLLGRIDDWYDGGSQNYPSSKGFLNPIRLETQLMSSCKCILEVSPWGMYNDETSDYNSDYISDFADNFDPPSQKSTSSRGEELALMEAAQYHQIDPARTTVQLLHRSARDFLLEPGCLDVLLEEISTSKGFVPGFRPLNGHAYLLYFAKAWLNLDQNVKSQLRCEFNVIEELAHHAPCLEPTLKTDIQPLFTLLDALDRELTLCSDNHECWPLDWYHSVRANSEISSWFFTFPAFAAAKDMKGYMQHLIEVASQRNDRDHFLNQKDGRPLHFFAAYMPWETAKPRMLEYLLQQGGDIHAKFDGKTIMESVVINRESKTSAEEIGVIKLLLNYGADVNSRYLHFPHLFPLFWPILHIVAHFTHIERELRIDLMQFLQSKGADLNSVDGFGQTFAEVLYWHGVDMSSPNWDWLFRKGAKITERMISTRYLERNGSRSVSTPQDIGETNKIDNGGNAIPSGMRYHKPKGYEYHSEVLTYPSTPWSWPSSSKDTSNLREAQSWLIQQGLVRFGLKGICDESCNHDAWRILTQRKFRKREWYTEDAAAAAEICKPGWFVNPYSNNFR